MHIHTTSIVLLKDLLHSASLSAAPFYQCTHDYYYRSETSNVAEKYFYFHFVNYSFLFTELMLWLTA